MILAERESCISRAKEVEGGNKRNKEYGIWKMGVGGHGAWGHGGMGGERHGLGKGNGEEALNQRGRPTLAQLRELQSPPLHLYLDVPLHPGPMCCTAMGRLGLPRGTCVITVLFCSAH